MLLGEALDFSFLKSFQLLSCFRAKPHVHNTSEMHSQAESRFEQLALFGSGDSRDNIFQELPNEFKQTPGHETFKQWFRRCLNRFEIPHWITGESCRYVDFLVSPIVVTRLSMLTSSGSIVATRCPPNDSLRTFK